MEFYAPDGDEWDPDAWDRYPHHRKFFDKLWLSYTLGYNCGPCGYPPNKTGIYIVRPCYNLDGMGIGAKVCMIQKEQMDKTPAGHFWCEFFEGRQFSVNYKWINGELKPTSSMEGFKPRGEMIRFDEWKRSDYMPSAHQILNQLSDVEYINVEYIEDKIIEVHLRAGRDPMYDHIVPVWDDRIITRARYEAEGYKFIPYYEAAYGQIKDNDGNKYARLGFMVK